MGVRGAGEQPIPQERLAGRCGEGRLGLRERQGHQELRRQCSSEAGKANRHRGSQSADDPRVRRFVQERPHPRQHRRCHQPRPSADAGIEAGQEREDRRSGRPPPIVSDGEDQPADDQRRVDRALVDEQQAPQGKRPPPRPSVNASHPGAERQTEQEVGHRPQDRIPQASDLNRNTRDHEDQPPQAMSTGSEVRRKGELARHLVGGAARRGASSPTDGCLPTSPAKTDSR